MAVSIIDKREVVVHIENIKSHVVLFYRDGFFERVVIHKGSQSFLVSSQEFPYFVELINEANMALVDSILESTNEKEN